MSALTPHRNIYLAQDLFRKPVPIPDHVEDKLFGIMRSPMPPDWRQCDRFFYGLINLANVLTARPDYPSSPP
jgi:hypothetical protein